jgi:hypothetical protein
MITAWDAIVRVWLVITTWLAVRRPPRLAHLARIREPLRFVRAAMIAAGRPTGGQVALAIAMLPRRRRTEAMIAFVACRTLHAIDALSSAPADAHRRVTSAIAYFVGEASGPTRLDTRGPRNFNAVLAARMSLVRAALDLLPGDAARRCCEIIERIGEGLIRARSDRAQFAEHARSEAVLYAIRLAAPIVRPPIAACEAAGRVIPLARQLRRAPNAQARDVALDRALPALAFVPRLMRWLPVALGPGTRAAMTLLATTIYPFARLELTSVPPRRLRHPLRAALAAACSRQAYLATATAIEDVLHEARAGMVSRLAGLALGSVVSPQPGAPGSDATLIARALELVQVAPGLCAERSDGENGEINVEIDGEISGKNDGEIEDAPTEPRGAAAGLALPQPQA